MQPTSPEGQQPVPREDRSPVVAEADIHNTVLDAAQEQVDNALPPGMEVTPVNPNNASDAKIAADIASATGNPDAQVYTATTPNPEPLAREEAPAQSASTGNQIIGRGGNVLTPGWTEDPARPGVLTRKIDMENPDDRALAAKLTDQADRFTAMSAAATAEAQARNAQIAAAQEASNQPIPGGINEVPLTTPAPETTAAPTTPIIDKVPTPEELAMLRTQGVQPTPEA